MKITTQEKSHIDAKERFEESVLCTKISFKAQANQHYSWLNAFAISTEEAGPPQQILKPSSFMMSYLFETEAFTLVEDSDEA